jgi:hypothetical protein
MSHQVIPAPLVNSMAHCPYSGVAAPPEREYVTVTDYANIEAGIAAALAAGKWLYFPAGNYHRASTLELTSSEEGLKMFGDGATSRIYRDDTGWTLWCEQTTDIEIEGLMFETITSTSTDDMGICIRSCSYLTFNDIHTKGGYYGMYVRDAPSEVANAHIVVDGLTVTSC